jgi:hypothetical protein
MLADIKIYSQATDKFFKYNISHSIGSGFEEREIAFYVSASRLIYKNLSIGLKGGIYNFSENTVDKIIDTFIAPVYSQLNAGNYSVHINNLTVRGATYVGSIQSSLRLPVNFSVNACIGIKYYTESSYSLDIEFNKYTGGGTVPRTRDIYFEELEPFAVKDVIKPYFSVGADYSFGILNMGIYADNIYSAGLTMGVSF